MAGNQQRSALKTGSWGCGGAAGHPDQALPLAWRREVEKSRFTREKARAEAGKPAHAPDGYRVAAGELIKAIPRVTSGVWRVARGKRPAPRTWPEHGCRAWHLVQCQPGRHSHCKVCWWCRPAAGLQRWRQAPGAQAVDVLFLTGLFVGTQVWPCLPCIQRGMLHVHR